jgi:hypothetical protein
MSTRGRWIPWGRGPGPRPEPRIPDWMQERVISNLRETIKPPPIPSPIPGRVWVSRGFPSPPTMPRITMPPPTISPPMPVPRVPVPTGPTGEGIPPGARPLVGDVRLPPPTPPPPVVVTAPPPTRVLPPQEVIIRRLPTMI